MDISNILNSLSPIIVCFSGGKDSVAMVLYLLELGVDKDRIHLHHHDVDGRGEKLFDWACTESYVESFAKHFDLKLFYSYRKGGIAREIYRNNESKQDVYFQIEPGGEFHIAPSDKKFTNTRMKFPALSNTLNTRWCSGSVKIDVIRTAIAHNPAYLGEIFILTGERRQESANRAKYEQWELHKTNSKSRSAMAFRPIIDWTEQEVWDIMKRWNVEPHPAYHLYFSRCSCQLCIFNDSDIWAVINTISPEKVIRIANIEADIEHTLYNKLTIAQKVLAGNLPGDLDPYWIAQATTKFTAPIIRLTEWVLPVGAFMKVRAGAA